MRSETARDGGSAPPADTTFAPRPAAAPSAVLFRLAKRPPHNPPMQWTEPAGKHVGIRESARRRPGH